MSSDIVLSVRNVSKAFVDLRKPMQALSQAYHACVPDDGSLVLRDISFDLHRGEAIGIVGRNGAGKSTLLKIISGVMRPSVGSVARQGRLAAMLELGAAFNPDFTGRENVRFVARILGLSPDEVDAIIDPVRAFADIGEFFERRVAEYSSGMFARLAFAVNLHSKPDIFIIDEALAVGDILFQFKCFNYLEQYRADGGTLLLVAHDENAVRNLCDRAIWLDHGRMMAIGKADHVCGLYAATSSIAQAKTDPKLAPARAVVPPPDAPPATARARRGFDPGKLTKACLPRTLTGLRAWQEGRPDALLEGGRETHIAFRYDGPAMPRLEAAFLFRDRMAQIIFAGFLPVTAPGEVQFRFDLPSVASGDYVIEALVLQGAGEDRSLIDRSAPYPINMATKHIGGGFANIEMAAITLSPVTAMVDAR